MTDKTPPLTVAQRQARFKARKKMTGLVRVELFVKPDNVEKLKAYARKLES